jgi:hypothetical protein
VLLGPVGGSVAVAQNPVYTFSAGVGGTATDRGSAIATDANGNSYVTGMFTGTVDFDPGSATANLIAASSSGDVFVASYDAWGAYRWAFRLGSQGGNFQEGKAISVDANGNVLVCGSFSGTTDFDPGIGTANLTGSAPSGAGGFIAKYTGSGSYVWAFQLGAAIPNALAVDGSSNVTAAGGFSYPVDFNPGTGKATLTPAKSGSGGSAYSTDVFVARYSPAGGYLWAFRAGGSATDAAGSVALDGSGNVNVSGTFSGTVDFDPGRASANLTGPGIFVARYSVTGTYLWAFRLGGSLDDGLAVDANGDIVVTGRFSGTVDFDPAAGTASLAAVGTVANIFVARYSATGGYLWAFSPAASGNAWDVTIDGAGAMYLTGGLTAPTSDPNAGYPNDFDPGPGTVTFTGRAGFVASYTSAGALVWAFPLAADDYSGGAIAAGRGVSVDNNGDVSITGLFGGTIDFDPGTASSTQTTAGATDIFVARFAQQTMLKPDLPTHAASRISVGPNPFQDALSIGYDGVQVRIEIVDMTGRVVETRVVDGPGTVALGADLPGGEYLVRLTQAGASRQVMVRKMR